MIRIVDPEALGCGKVKFPELFDGHENGPVSGAEAAYYPAPQLDGNLQVDPDIHLRSPGMDVEIAYFYNSNHAYNGPFGYGRMLTPFSIGQAQAAATPAWVSFTRGTGQRVSYAYDSATASYKPSTSGLLNTLVKDTGNGLWKETTPAGKVLAYPLYASSSRLTSISYIQDPIGNRHTFGYSAGRPETLQDAVGRKVSFLYNGSNLLETIEDWAGRRTTFQYDTVSVSGKPLMTQVTGPTGCVTQYDYDGFARLIEVTDPNGYATTYDYFSNSQVKERSMVGIGTNLYTYTANSMVMTTPSGAVFTHLLNYLGDQQSVIEPDGVRMTHVYNDRGQILNRVDFYGGSEGSVYDSTGVFKIASVDSYGRRSTYTRDAYQNGTKLAYADGTIITRIFGYAGSSFDTTGAKRKLQAWMDPLGNRTSFSYNGRGQMIAEQDPLGNRTTYGYDAFGNRQSVMNALGQITTMTYDLAGNVVATTDPLGYITSVTYDAQDRPTEVMDPLGYVNTTVYDSAGNVIVIIDALNNATTFTYDAFANPVGKVDMLGFRSTRVYDDQGRQIALIDALGNATTTIYDLAGRTVAEQDPLGYLTTTVYDKAARVSARQDALGGRTTIVYDLNSAEIAEVDALGFYTTYSYDTVNRMVSTRNARGYYTTTVYDVAGRAIASINALGYRTTTVYDGMARDIASVDQLGYRNTVIYDAAGRVSSEIDAFGYRTSYSYDPAGRLVQTQDAVNKISSSIYDARGRMLQSFNWRGMATTFGYDAVGHQVMVQQPRYSTGFNMVTTAVYDTVGRMVAVVDITGGRSTTAYDGAGRSISMQDALGRVTTAGYDAAGRTRFQQDALGYLTTLTYDALGRQIAVQDAVGNITTNIYNKRSDLLSIRSPWGAITTYSYDSVGNLLSQRDGRNYAMTHTYDALDQVTKSVATNGAIATYIYNRVGQQVSMFDSAVLATTTYDGRGLVTQVAVQGAGSAVAYNLNYQYDGVGNRVLLSDGEGHVTTYIYEESGPNQSIFITPPYEETTICRSDYQGQPYQTHFADETVANEAIFHNNRGWLQYTQYGQPEDDVARYMADFDKVGNRLDIRERSDIAAPYTYTYYSYDDTDQLLSARREDEPGYATTYTYDGVGNRLTQDSLGVLTTYSYLPGNRLYSEVTGGSFTTYTYDLAGNLTNIVDGTGARTTYSWNTDNRLVLVDDASGSESLSYGSDGLRYKKIIIPAVGSPLTRHFAWDGQNLHQERDENGLIIVQNAWAPGGENVYTGQAWDAGDIGDRLLLQRRTAIPGDLAAGASSYFGQDVNANTRLIFDSSGNITDRMSYQAFGEMFERDGATEIPFLFAGTAGYYTDDIQRLDAHWRAYDPTSGRWISADPIGLEGGDWNLYRYVANTPINFIDPSGLARDPTGGSCDKIGIVLNTFIPTAKVRMIGCLKLGNGDNRGFLSSGGTYRTMHTVIVNVKTGQTRTYEKISTSTINLVFGAKLRRPGQNRQSLKTYVNPDKVRGGWNIHIEGNAKHGFTPCGIGPGITYRLKIHLNRDGSAIVYREHTDAYPAYELWEYNGTKEPRIMYGQMPIFGGIFNLLPTLGAW